MKLNRERAGQHFGRDCVLFYLCTSHYCGSTEVHLPSLSWKKNPRPWAKNSPLKLNHFMVHQNMCALLEAKSRGVQAGPGIFGCEGTTGMSESKSFLKTGCRVAPLLYTSKKLTKRRICYRAQPLLLEIGEPRFSQISCAFAKSSILFAEKMTFVLVFRRR